ncbi:MAG TPA: LCP family protein [Acidimicrobiia bacterium]
MSSSRSGVRAWFRTYLIALTTAAAVTVGGLFGVNYVYDRKVDNIERVENLDLDENTDPAEPANFLLIGSDTRAFVETEEQEEAFGDAESQGGQRSDTIMVVHVDPEAQTGLLISFPRDLLVDIPGMGESKINAAYNEGPNKVIETLQSNFDIPIHHYLEVDFVAFEGIVNAVGGVPVYFPAPARDEKTGLDVPPGFGWQPGCYELGGQQALAYVRSRSYEQFDFDTQEWELDPTADIGRIERQQAFMKRIAAEAVATALANPLKANSVADEALAELKADEDLSRTDINKLIQAFRRVDPNDPQSIELVAFPWEEAGNGADLVPNMEAAAPYLARLRTLEPPSTSVPADGPAPSSIRVRVFNGSGVSGAAAQTLAALGDHGFQGAGTGNNPENVDETEIRYRPGSEDKAEVVRSLLAGDVGRLVQDDAIVEADVQLVIGADFDGVSPPAGSAPADTTAAPETTVAPATTEEDGVAPDQLPEAEPADPC